jgi:hypothetical protein
VSFVPLRSRAKHVGNDCREFAGTCNGARRNNRLRNPSGMPLLTETRDYICNFRLRRRVDEIGRGFAGNLHAHIERSIRAK